MKAAELLRANSPLSWGALWGGHESVADKFWASATLTEKGYTRTLWLAVLPSQVGDGTGSPEKLGSCARCGRGKGCGRNYANFVVGDLSKEASALHASDWYDGAYGPGGPEAAEAADAAYYDASFQPLSASPGWVLRAVRAIGASKKRESHSKSNSGISLWVLSTPRSWCLAVAAEGGHGRDYHSFLRG